MNERRINCGGIRCIPIFSFYWGFSCAVDAGALPVNVAFLTREEFRWTPPAPSVKFRDMSKAKGAVSVPEDTQNLPFEEALHRLESIVEAMEAQDLPLETLLAKFEEGTKLAYLCQVRLNDAELKIQQLEKNAKGDLSLKPAALNESI